MSSAPPPAIITMSSAWTAARRPRWRGARWSRCGRPWRRPASSWPTRRSARSPHAAPRARPMDAELALRTRGLSVDLGDHRVLDSVTLDVPRGAVVGLVGPNGAGKTTLLRAVAGMLPAADGSIELGGTVSYMPQLGPGAWDFPLDALEVALQGSYR